MGLPSTSTCISAFTFLPFFTQTPSRLGRETSLQFPIFYFLRSHVVRMSVCPSVCNVGGSGSHRLKILETNCTDTQPNTFALRSPKFIHLLPGEHGKIFMETRGGEDAVELDSSPTLWRDMRGAQGASRGDLCDSTTFLLKVGAYDKLSSSSSWIRWQSGMAVTHTLSAGDDNDCFTVTSSSASSSLS